MRRLSALFAATLAACAAEPPPADPAAWVVNTREHGKLMDLGECHGIGEADGLAAGSPAQAAFVERCMDARGYTRTDSPLARR